MARRVSGNVRALADRAPKRRHNLLRQNLDCDPVRGATPAHARDLPPRGMLSLLLALPRLLLHLSHLPFLMFQYLTVLSFFSVIVFVFRRKHKAFSSSRTSLHQHEIPEPETRMILLPPYQMHPLLQTREAGRPPVLAHSSKQQEPHLKKHWQVQIPLPLHHGRSGVWNKHPLLEKKTLHSQWLSAGGRGCSSLMTCKSKA